MNDRFKFRVWHKPLKTMHYNDFIVTATGYMAKIYQQDDYMMKFNQEDLEFDKQYVFMQCTGLKDKNGKLIYETDILQQSQLPHKVVCEWYKDGFWLNGFMNGAKRELRTMHNWYEVIGNIYQDSHLLEN